MQIIPPSRTKTVELPVDLTPRAVRILQTAVEEARQLGAIDFVGAEHIFLAIDASFVDWAYRYDPDTVGLTRVIDPNGKVSVASYDSAGNMISKTDALGRQTTFAYNSLRQVTSISEPRKVNDQPIVRSFTYDPAGNLLTESAPLLDANGDTVATATTTNQYDDPTHPGDITSRTDPNGNRTSYTYDSFGNLTSITAPPTPENPDGNRTSFEYDTARGWLTSAVSPRGNLPGADPSDYTTTFSHDAYGRVTEVRDPLWSATAPTERRTVSTYDADGNLVSVTDGNNHITRYAYDAAGRRTEIQRADDSILRTEYWPDGSIKQQIDGANQATSYDYNPLGQLLSVTDPLNRATRYTYDGVGNVLTMTNPSGRRTTLSYDCDDAGAVARVA